MIVITRHAPLLAYLVEQGVIPAATLPVAPAPSYCPACGGANYTEALGPVVHRCACAPARVISHATPEDIRGQDVIGVLPLHLAALARTVTEVPLALTPEDRIVMQSGDLPIERLREIAGAPVRYEVRVV